MDLASFAHLFGPPPGKPPLVDWVTVEGWLGLTLPTDYTMLASTYGPLDIGEFVWLYTPCVEEARFDYGEWLRHTHREARIASRKVSPPDPPPMHPAAGGLLAWGATRRSSYLFWDTGASPDPDEWPVVVFHRDAMNQRRSPWQTYPMSLLATLCTLVTDGLDLPGDAHLGPLPATASRTAFLTEARAWTPPVPEPEVVPEPLRRAALTEGTGLAALRLVVPPPAVAWLGAGTWQGLFDELGTHLPADYVTLMNCYGAGIWSDWLRFVTPLRTDGRGFLYQATEVLDGYRDLREDFPAEHPLACWPEPGGFLPFASSIDGDDLG